MDTFKLRKVKTNQSYQASDCGVSYSLNPVYQDNDDAYTETELVWIKEFEIPRGYRVNAFEDYPDELGIFDEVTRSIHSVPIVDIEGRLALSTWSGELVFLSEVVSDI